MLATALGFTEPTLLVSTPGAGQTGLNYPLQPNLDTATVLKMRVNLFLQALTVPGGKMEVQVGIQLSDDASTWPSSTTAPTFFATAVKRDTEGYTTTITAFENVASLLTKKYARLVLWVKNISTNEDLSTCLASVRVEIQRC